MYFRKSFARRQPLFDIAPTPIDVDWNFMSYPAPLSLFQFRPKCNHLICWWCRLPSENFIETRSVFLRNDRKNYTYTQRAGPSRFCCCCSIQLERSTCWHSTVRKHSHFQTPPENPSVQTHLVLPYCIKRLCIIVPKGAIQIRYLTFFNLPRPTAATATTTATA